MTRRSNFFLCYNLLYLANLSNNCLVPELRNTTVALQFSPEPSILMTSPTPKRVCSMRSPGCNGESDEEEGAGLDCGAGLRGELDSETVENGGWEGWGVERGWIRGREDFSPSIWRKRGSMSRMKRDGVSNSIRPYLNLFCAQVRKQCFSALVIATYNSRRSSSSPLILSLHIGEGKMFSSSPTTKTVLNSSPFAACIVISTTFGSSESPSLSRSVISDTSCRKSVSDTWSPISSSLRSLRIPSGAYPPQHQ